MELLHNEAIYRRVIVELLPQTRKFHWIITADIKDLHVPKGRRFVPLLEILSDLIDGGVAVRLMHAKEPRPRFREDFDRYPNLVKSDLFERILCPRIHTKAVVIDGKQAFIGSANLTGAGIGAKGGHKRTVIRWLKADRLEATSAEIAANYAQTIPGGIVKRYIDQIGFSNQTNILVSQPFGPATGSINDLFSRYQEIFQIHQFN